MKRATVELAERMAKRYMQQLSKGSSRTADKKPRVITISRMFGAGGISVSGLLAKKLGIQVWDREILDLLADQSKGRYQSQMFEALDERTQGTIENFLATVSGRLGKDTYLYLLQKALLIVAQNDAIILGRGANLLLPGAFRVFLKASMDTRIRNVMKLLGVDEKRARKEIKRREEEREQFLAEITNRFGKNLPSRSSLPYDLEINTDTLDFDAAVEVICTAADAFFGKGCQK